MITQLLGVFVVLVAHVALIYSTRWFGFLFLVFAVYTINGVFGSSSGVGSERSFVTYLSTYLPLLMVLVGLVGIGLRFFTGATRWFLLFYLLLVAGSLYSDHPVGALKFKLLGMLTIVAGIYLAHSVADINQLRKDLRMLLIAFTVVVLSFVGHILLFGLRGRLDAYGLNSNWIGIILASCICFTSFLAAWDRSVVVRTYSGTLSCALFILLLFAGSRSGIAAGVLGAIVCFLPMLRKPGRLVSVILVIGILAFFAAQRVTLEQSVSERLQDFTADTGRLPFWQYVLENEMQSIVFGSGAVFSTSYGAVHWANYHSIYVQILVELGIVGSLFFVFVILNLIQRSLRLAVQSPYPEKWLAMSAITVSLSIGGFESAPLRGGMLIAMVWAFGIGLLDRLPQIAAADQQVLQRAGMTIQPMEWELAVR